MLDVKNLSYAPPGTKIIQSGLSFTVKPGELLHIKGSNGCGKSLLSRVIMGEIEATEGKIDNSFKSTKYLAQMQNKATHLPFSLGDILSASKKIGKISNLNLLETRHLSLAWNNASGGERQRTLLTRFFSESADLLIIDEPFNHLDLHSKDLVRNLIKKHLVTNPNGAAVLISHEDNPKEWAQNIQVKTIDLDGTRAQNL